MASVHKPLRVILTRPEAQAQVWAQQLSEQGFQPVCASLLEIAPLVLPEQIQAIKNKIMDLDLYQKVIFVSQNAVHYGMEWIENYWPQIPLRVDFFAVGATTAKIVADYGLAVQDLATSNGGGMTSEDLLQAPQLQQVSGEKILIMRGCGGRGHLADELQARGARVDYCELYQRLLPEGAFAQWQVLLLDTDAWQHTHTVISLHSGESLENLLLLLARLEQILPQQNIRMRLFDVCLLVPSARIAAAAKLAGFKNCIAAQNATDVAMTAALLNYYRAATAP